MLAIFPSGIFEPPREDIPGDDLQANYLDATEEEWTLQFDGSSAEKKGRSRGCSYRKGWKRFASPTN